MRNTFKAYERLKREQHIDTLFRKGKAFSVLSGKFIYLLTERDADLSPARVGFSVPKKRFKRAHDRNRVKRLLREAWRQQKGSLYATIPADKQLHLFFIYTGASLPEYTDLTEVMAKGIEKLQQTFPKINDNVL